MVTQQAKSELIAWLAASPTDLEEVILGVVSINPEALKLRVSDFGAGENVTEKIDVIRLSKSGNTVLLSPSNQLC